MTHPHIAAIREALERIADEKSCTDDAMLSLIHLTALESLVGGGWQPIGDKDAK